MKTEAQRQRNGGGAQSLLQINREGRRRRHTDRNKGGDGPVYRQTFLVEGRDRGIGGGGGGGTVSLTET